MCTVATDRILLIQLIGKTVHIGLLRHGLMESSVKNKNLRGLGHYLKATLDALNVSTGVQRSQIATQLQLCHNILIQQYRFGEESTAMHDSVTNSLNLVHALDATVISVKQSLNNTFHSNSVIGNGNRNLVNLTGQQLLMGKCTVNTNAVTQTLCNNGVAGRIKQLILQRAGTGVYNKNVHLYNPPSQIEKFSHMILYLIRNMIARGNC